MVLLSLILTLSSVSLSVAKPAANLNVSATTLESLGCDATCQRILSNAQKKDEFGTDFDFDFYATARNFSSSKPGDLLKFQSLNGSSLDVVDGLSVYRYQYISRSLNGSVVPATGFIGIPYASFRPDGKYPVVAYAHGTSGVSRGCGPSSSPKLYDYNTWSILTRNGYAVVAPDYSGLGNNHIEHEYVSFPAQANDVYYGMVAARQAFPNIFTDDWASIGHSQGGGAVWKLSESTLIKTGTAGNHVGTVSLAPALRVHDMVIVSASNNTSYDTRPESVWLPLALRRAIPSADISFFSQKLLDRVRILELTQSCYIGGVTLGVGLPKEDLFTSTDALKNSTDFRHWQEMVSPAMGDKGHNPLLIIQGLDDSAVWPPSTIDAFQDTCKYGNDAHLSLYPGMDHSDVLSASSPEWLSFLRERFEGKTSRGGCKKTVNTPFDASHMAAKPEDSEWQDL